MRRERLELVAAFVKSVDADVVALQEVALASVDGDVWDQPALLGQLTGTEFRYASVYGYPFVELPNGVLHGATLWGNAILSRHPIVGAATHALPIPTDDTADDPVDVEPRCLLACVIDAPGGRLTVMSTHLAWLGARARLPQATRVAELVAQADGPVVLAGDLNAPIESDELAPLRFGLDDTFWAIGIAPGDDRRRSCGRDRIDHVLTRGFEIVDCRVAHEASDASDHLPVIARLRFSGESGSS